VLAEKYADYCICARYATDVSRGGKKTNDEYGMLICKKKK
jgi:hypothetical protein